MEENNILISKLCQEQLATIKLLLQSIRNHDLTCSLCTLHSRRIQLKRKHALKRHIPVMNNTSHNYTFSGNFHMYQSKSVKTPDGTERLHQPRIKGVNKRSNPMSSACCRVFDWRAVLSQDSVSAQLFHIWVGDIYPLMGMKGQVLLGR